MLLNSASFDKYGNNFSLKILTHGEWEYDAKKQMMPNFQSFQNFQKLQLPSVAWQQ